MTVPTSSDHLDDSEAAESTRVENDLPNPKFHESWLDELSIIFELLD